MPLGIVPMGAFPPPPPVKLLPGDQLILYTDGFTEAANEAGECFGEERLGDIVKKGWEAGLNPTDMMQMIVKAVDEFVDGRPHEDDLTMVVVGITNNT
jgi:serine phosphatase RsbU (regulator of sigma subunit)